MRAVVGEARGREGKGKEKLCKQGSEFYTYDVPASDSVRNGFILTALSNATVVRLDLRRDFCTRRHDPRHSLITSLFGYSLALLPSFG